MQSCVFVFVEKQTANCKSQRAQGDEQSPIIWIQTQTQRKQTGAHNTKDAKEDRKFAKQANVSCFYVRGCKFERFLCRNAKMVNRQGGLNTKHTNMLRFHDQLRLMFTPQSGTFKQYLQRYIEGSCLVNVLPGNGNMNLLYRTNRSHVHPGLSTTATNSSKKVHLGYSNKLESS